MKKCFASALLVLAVLLTFGSAYAGYNYTSFDAPGALYGTYAYGINNAGTIVGTSNNSGFILSNGSYAWADYPGALTTYAMSINNTGTIVGPYFNSSGCYGYTLTGGTYAPLNSSMWGFSYAINDSGTIVGAYGTGGSFSLNNGMYTTLNVPGAKPGLSAAYGINNAGDIVGLYGGTDDVGYGYLLSNGTYTSLTVTGATTTQAFAINNSGSIVGTYYAGGLMYHGFILSNGTYTTIDYPGAVSTLVRGINDHGTIVGYYQDTNWVTHGFVATPVPLLPGIFLLAPGLAGLAVLRRRFRR